MHLYIFIFHYVIFLLFSVLPMLYLYFVTKMDQYKKYLENQINHLFSLIVHFFYQNQHDQFGKIMF